MSPTILEIKESDEFKEFKKALPSDFTLNPELNTEEQYWEQYSDLTQYLFNDTIWCVIPFRWEVHEKIGDTFQELATSHSNKKLTDMEALQLSSFLAKNFHEQWGKFREGYIKNSEKGLTEVQKEKLWAYNHELAILNTNLDKSLEPVSNDSSNFNKLIETFRSEAVKKAKEIDEYYKEFGFLNEKQTLPTSTKKLQWTGNVDEFVKLIDFLVETGKIEKGKHWKNFCDHFENAKIKSDIKPFDPKNLASLSATLTKSNQPKSKLKKFQADLKNKLES